MMAEGSTGVHDPHLVLVELTVDELEVAYRALVERWLRIERDGDDGVAGWSRHDFEVARVLSARFACWLVDHRPPAEEECSCSPG